MRTTILILTLLFCTSYVYVASAQEPNAPGVTAWALGGAGVQELRVGYEGLLPDVEVAAGLQHIDAPDETPDRWPIRAYVIAHALDANMVASLLGGNMHLPDGSIYAGLFAQYTDEWAGGYILGGAVDWPRGWQVVVEYQQTLWYVGSSDQTVLVGLRRRF